jgi:hypothetical protein
MPPINFVEHALERMSERGISEAEVLKTLKIGKKEPAKYGRIKFSLEFIVNDDEKKKEFSKKIVIVLAEKNKSVIDVISVYAKFY